MKASKDITGQRFGRLVILERDDDYISPGGSTAPVYKCRCDCGKIVSIRKSSIVNGNQLSCGCLSIGKYQINTIDDVLPKEQLIKLYVDEQWSLRKLQDEYHIQRHIISDRLKELGIPIRDAHSKEYYRNRRKYDEWQTGSRDYNKIMEEHIGRALTDFEVVHHIDFNRDHNEIENLFLFENSIIHGAYHGFLINHEYMSPGEFVAKYAKIYETVLSYCFLFDEYINQHKSVARISKENIPVSRTAITKRLKEYGLFDLRPKSKNQLDNHIVNAEGA